MPEISNYIEYHKSLARELNATKDRIRQLIGNRHWLTDGEHKEAVLRKVLRNHLPESVRVSRGFVCFSNDVSTQIDILITRQDRPTLFKDGELVLVTPDVVHAIIEVKTKISTAAKLRKALIKLADNAQRIRCACNDRCLAGLFIYEDNQNRNTLQDREVLEELQSAANGEASKAINWIAFGANRFFRYWSHGIHVASIYDGGVWHSYNLTDGLSHAYFLSNVIWDITYEHDNNDRDTQYAWFPVEGGKERYRRWCIPRLVGDARSFDHE